MSDWSDEFLGRALIAATLLVIAGVFLEVAEIVEEISEHGWQFRNPFKWITRFGFVLLMIGLGGEFFASTKIHDRDTGRISSLTSESDRLRAESIALEKDLKLADIHLTDRQIDAENTFPVMASDLAPYMGQKIVVEYVANDDEAERFANNLVDLLNSPFGGKWNAIAKPFVRPPQPPRNFNVPLPSGIIGPFFAKAPPQNSKMGGAIFGLVDFFKSQNFCFTATNVVDWADPDPNTLTLLISSKDRTSKAGCL